MEVPNKDASVAVVEGGDAGGDVAELLIISALNKHAFLDVKSSVLLFSLTPFSQQQSSLLLYHAIF